LIIYISNGKKQIKSILINAFKRNLQKKYIKQYKTKKNEIVSKKNILNDEFKMLNLNNFNNLNNNIALKIKRKNKQKANNIRNKNSHSSTTNRIIHTNGNDGNFNQKNKNNKLNIYFGNSQLLDYNELNNLEYSQAKKLDKRDFLQIYWSLLKREHPFIFAFITKDDYNITMIKYSRFIILLCTDMAMNVFFFSDETMHKMFLNYGKYDFIQQIPQIIYSTIISKLLELLFCIFSMTDKYYYQIKNDKRINKELFSNLKKRIKIKISFFFIFSILMFTFYWYLITCFCAIYQNTQSTMIKNSLFSFLLDNITIFIIYLFPSLLRIISLKSDISCSRCIYHLSNIIPFF